MQPTRAFRLLLYELYFLSLFVPTSFFLYSYIIFYFFKIFWRTHVLSWGYWYPCFGLVVISPLGFKARVGSLIHTCRRCIICFPKIHLLCNTWQPLADSIVAKLFSSTYLWAGIRVFHSLYKVGRNGNFVFKGFNNSKKKLPLVGLDLLLQIITGLGVQCLTIWAKQACAISGIFKLLFMHHLIFGLRGTERI